jgi:hypothetical protein
VRIRRVSVDGFRGLPDREFVLGDPGAPRGPDLVVVTGPTASGKTSFLEAIIAGKEKLAPYGPVQPDTNFIRAGVDAAKVKILWELDAQEREDFGSDAMTLESEAMFGGAITDAENDPALLGLLTVYETEPESSKVEYFHATRRMAFGGGEDPTQISNKTNDRQSRLTRDQAKFNGLVKFVVAAGMGFDLDREGNPRPAGRVTGAFEKLCKTKKLAGLYRASDGVYPGFQDSAGRPVGVAQLSDGEADAFLFAVSFVRNGIRRSVVLIDTPELHKSDAEAKAFVEGLMKVEQDNQLIVATRAPSIVGMVPANRIVNLG